MKMYLVLLHLFGWCMFIESHSLPRFNADLQPLIRCWNHCSNISLTNLLTVFLIKALCSNQIPIQSVDKYTIYVFHILCLFFSLNRDVRMKVYLKFLPWMPFSRNLLTDFFKQLMAKLPQCEIATWWIMISECGMFLITDRFLHL